MADFEVYLHSLVTAYEQWWNLYALTDAIGQIREPEQGQATSSPSPFDFGLMVQTVSNEREPPSSEADSPKIERLPVLEGIRKYAADEHVLLIGRPGSGKSTALIRLLLEMATQALEQGTGQIPVLIELRYWQTSILERIRAFLHKHDPELDLDDETLRSLLRQGRFILLIDGLNELPSEAARTQLSSFRQDYAKVPMIFTTRDLSLGGDLSVEKKLEMQPLTEGQMKDFIRAYVPDQAEVMLRQLNDRLREFGQTPLLLWMLCEVFQQSPGNQMPSNLAGIFQAFTKMYENNSARKHEVALLKGDVRPLSDRRIWKEALQALASVMMQGETPVDFRVAIDRDEAERELGRIFADERFPVRDILDDLLKYHLLQNRGDEQIEFRHQLIQEYYAAEWLLKLLPELSDDELKRDYLNLLKWTESIALMLALVREEEQALRVVKLALDDVDLMLGARLAGEVKPELQSTTVEWVVQRAVKQSIRIFCLAKTRSGAAVQELLKGLENGKGSIRQSAAKALGEIATETVTLELLKKLESKKRSVRKSAVMALKEIGSEIAIPALLKALDDKKASIRQIAITALEEIGGDTAIAALFKMLEDEDSSVRQSAVSALGEAGEVTNVTVLLKALEDKDSSIRRIAARRLGGIDSELAMPALLKALKSDDPFVRRIINRELRKIDSQTLKPELADLLEDSDSRKSRFAANLLNKIDSKENFRGLTKTLPIQSFSALQKFNGLLAEFSYEEAMDELLKGLEDKSSDVRLKTIELLGELGGEKAILGLTKALSDKSRYLRQSAAYHLGEIGGELAVPALQKLLSDKAPSIRQRACEALGKIGGEAAVTGLFEMLEEQDSAVQSAVIQALGRVAEPSLIPQIWQICLKGKSNLISLITAIQNRCKFYNYEVFHNLDLISPGKTISLYFSYAPADEPLQTQLANHLTLLERQNVITSWNKRQILPGDEPTQVINQQLNTADVILLLISANSLADDTCYDLEIQRAIERHQAGEARVVPILLRPVDWTGLPLSQLEVLPKGQRAVTSWENQDEAFEEIAREIREVAMEVRRVGKKGG